MNEQAHIIESLKYKNKQLRADKEQLKLSNRGLKTIFAKTTFTYKKKF